MIDRSPVGGGAAGGAGAVVVYLRGLGVTIVATIAHLGSHSREQTTYMLPNAEDF